VAVPGFCRMEKQNHEDPLRGRDSFLIWIENHLVSCYFFLVVFFAFFAGAFFVAMDSSPPFINGIEN
jgi:hypothetical protein